MPQIHFVPDGRTVTVPGGTTILEAALAAGLPHTHACGGFARCSTCRVLVVEGLAVCEPRNAEEQVIADRIRCGAEIRLACQTSVAGDVTVRRLVLDPEDVELTDLREAASSRRVGEERHVAVLFCDIRGFTAFAESLLPYDVIHVLRRLFHEVDRIVAGHGGTVTSYMGDGLMALFGMTDPDGAAEQAVRAGLDILDAALAMQPYLEELHGRGLEVNVGVHCGEAVVGTVGGTTGSGVVTAIGDCVNLASRIEAANKVTGTRLLVSDETLALVGARAVKGRSFRLALPGKTGEHDLHEVVAWREG